MIVFVYDKSFEGLLTAFFEIYSRRVFPDMVVGKDWTSPTLFDTASFEVVSDSNKANRVWRGLEKRLSGYALWSITACWMSQLPDIEMLLLRYMKIIMDSKSDSELDFGNKYILEVARISKKMARERERVVQFARFRQGADGIYYAAIEPLYNVLPFTVNYFAERFAFQKWLVYDVKREYGYYYNMKEVMEINPDATGNVDSLADGILSNGQMGNTEIVFQKLWQEYFRSTAIKERLNPRLHKQNLPVRFWKYLTEKHR